MIKCLFFSYVIHEEGSDSTTVVWTGNRTKVLLPGSVPDLEFDVFVLDFDCFGTELDTDGDVVRETGFVLNELEDHAGFADTWVERDVPVSPMTMNLKR